jgi:quercetin dioxygenase-like cupin family protein
MIFGVFAECNTLFKEATMKRSTITTIAAFVAGMAASPILSEFVQAQQGVPREVRPLPLKHTVAHSMDLAGLNGKQGAVVAVEYAPGASDKKHYHPGHLFTYVIEGSVVWEVDGKAPVTLNAGDAFYDQPKQVHNHRNASATAPAKFVSFFVEDKGQPRSVPIK